MSVALQSAEHVAADQGVKPETGLSTAEAERRLATHGPNELRSAPRDPAWLRFLQQFKDPLVYLLLAAVAISVIAWALEGAHGFPVEAAVILAILVVNAALGFVQENQAADAVAALADMTASRATVLRDGRLVELPAAQVVPGDVLVLSEGDAVAADGRLVSATALQVAESSLTGESAAVTKDTAPLKEETPLGDQRCMVFKGTSVVRGVGRAVITATGMATEMGRIATLLDETEDDPTPLQREIATISRSLGIAVILVALGVMATLAAVNGVSSPQDLAEILLMGVSLAVAAVPEGLPAILSLCLAIGVRAMASRNAVMKQLHSTEALGSTSVIASDKTGTLTRNEMTIAEVRTASGRVRIEGTGYTPEGAIQPSSPEALLEAQLTLVAGSLANNAQLSHSDGRWSIQGDPTEAAFLVAERKLRRTKPSRPPQRLAEAPFSSERKLMSVLVRSHDSYEVLVKGAPDVLLNRCTHEQVGQHVRPLTAERRRALEVETLELGQQGYRTLAVAWRHGDQAETADFSEASEHDLIHAGVVGIIDPPRAEAREAIAQAHRAGIRTVMITGDHPVTATKIAHDLGLGGSERAVTGTELEAMTEAELVATAKETTVYARVSPEHKLHIVDALQADRQIVAMTGDGVNDAPALKTADIGVAMGITGTEVTKQASDMVLGDDNYATILAAVRQGRAIFDNIRKFMRYLLSSNMGEVMTVFLAVVLNTVIGLADPANPTAAFVPLLATQILWINLVTDSGPALAMGIDPELDDVMARPPRRYEDRIIDGHMWWRILGIGTFMGVVGLLIFDLTLPGGLIGGFEALTPTESQAAVARTTVFTALVLMQLANALNSRSDLGSAFHNLFSNRWLWASLVFGLVSQIAVVNVPWLQAAFGTVALPPAHWALAIGAGLAVLGFEEVIKAARRALGH
ncbi:MAG: cation-translocating P-type ATPase [Propionibacteriaceae bacterium]|nr:cation-translocating P-type ATPase [Propionibacteriaceae bacterium]